MGGLALPDISRDVGQFEELAPGMAPAKRALDGAGIAVAAIEIVVSTIGIGLEDALPAREMPVGVGHFAIAREVEQRRGRRATRERAIVMDISPQTRRLGPAFRQQRHRRVVAVQALSSEDVVTDQRMNRPERGGTGADLVGQGRQAEFDAFPRIALGLSVQGLMLAELLEEDRRQKVRPGPAA